MLEHLIDDNMSREIKFRFWDLEHQQWMDLCDFMGDYQHNAFRTYGEPFNLFDLFEDSFAENSSKTRYKEGKIISQQYTGLKDKNEKEIYEGDILKIHEHLQNEEVIYSNEETAFGFFLHDDQTRMDGTFEILGDYTSSQGYEVIGNIFENQELL